MAEDEARLEYEASLTSVWYKRGKQVIIKTTIEKKAKSFFGALNLRTGKVHIHVCDWQDQEETVKFLRKLRKAYPKKKIIMFWDGAPWHRSKRIRKYLRRTRNLELIRFPPYSPELNPQEHVWKEVRKEVSHNNEDLKFEPLVNKFARFLRKTKFNSNFLEKYGQKG